MKKTIFYGLLLTLLLPSLTWASFDVSLKYGSKGDAVSELQDFLTDQNVYAGKVDGKFGLGTLKAVKAFQGANNLSVDGYFGKASRATAQTLLAADLKTSDDAEQAETGTVTPPVVQTPPTTQTNDTGTQSKLDALTSEVQALTSQLQQNQQTAPVVTPIAPVIPPLTISNVIISKVFDGWTASHTKEEITWTTSIPTTSKVSYNANSSTFGDPTDHVITDDTLSVNHIADIDMYSSMPNTTYHFKIESVAKDGVNYALYNGSSTTPPDPTVSQLKPKLGIAQYTGFSDQTITKSTNTRVASFLLSSLQNTVGQIQINTIKINYDLSLKNIYLAPSFGQGSNISSDGSFSTNFQIPFNGSLIVDIFADTTNSSSILSPIVLSVPSATINGAGFEDHGGNITGQTITIQ